jgi:IclR family acetate operon transcriptional repressor
MAVEATTKVARSGAIGRGFEILRALRSSSSPMALTAVAESIGVAPSSAHSVLMQLLAQGAVIQDEDKRYQLGPVMFYIGSAYSRGSAIYRSTWVELINLANEFDLTGALATPWESYHLILQSHRAGESEVAVPFGGRVPIDGGSWGKVYYAFSAEEPPRKLTAYTAHSITDAGEFAAELEATRAAGYAIDRSEFSEGIGAVCAPVTSSAGYEGLASLLGPLERIEAIDPDVLGRRLAGLASRASLALGDSERVRFFGTF